MREKMYTFSILAAISFFCHAMCSGVNNDWFPFKETPLRQKRYEERFA